MDSLYRCFFFFHSPDVQCFANVLNLLHFNIFFRLFFFFFLFKNSVRIYYHKEI